MQRHLGDVDRNSTMGVRRKIWKLRRALRARHIKAGLNFTLGHALLHASELADSGDYHNDDVKFHLRMRLFASGGESSTPTKQKQI